MSPIKIITDVEIENFQTAMNRNAPIITIAIDTGHENFVLAKVEKFKIRV